MPDITRSNAAFLLPLHNTSISFKHEFQEVTPYTARKIKSQHLTRGCHTDPET